MAGIDRMNPGAALGAGAALAALNPKNLPLGLSAGPTLAQADGGDRIAGLVVFAVIAACSVLAPVIVYLLFRERMRRPLASAKDWLTRNNAAVMFVVFLILGAAMVGKGLGTLIT
jgi:threonine/homoserine/homoserine lactone efflux protein